MNNGDENKKIESSKRIHEKARYIRGRFLNHMAVIDHNISKILTIYFCRDDEEKQELFFRRIMGILSLENKRATFMEILKSDYPIYYIENAEILNSLAKLLEFRNKLAHSIVDVSDEALERPLEEGVGFILWKKGLPITDEQVSDYEVTANMVSSCLIDVERLLPFKQKEIE